MPVDYFKLHLSTKNIMTSDAEALRFRTVQPKSKGLVISGDGFVARNDNTLLSGLVYSNRPIRINENVLIHFTKFVDQFVNNYFGLGFTQPNSEAQLSESKEYICIKMQADNYYKQGNILHFYVNSAGYVKYGVDGRDIGQVSSKMDTSRPFWMVVDLHIFNTITLVNLHRLGIDVQRSHDVSSGRTQNQASTHQGLQPFSNRMRPPDFFNQNQYNVASTSRNVSSSWGQRSAPTRKTFSEHNQPPAVYRHQESVPTTSQHRPTTSTAAECVICTTEPANAIFIACGHRCACYECAVKQWRGPGDGRCPFCRKTIQQVQRTSFR